MEVSSVVEKLVGFFLSIFGVFQTLPFGKEIIVFLISLMPIVELRGGLIAAALLDLPPLRSCLIAFVANLLPVPFILWFINSVLNFMRNSKRFSKVAKWLDKKVEKHKKQIEKYGFWGMVLFVGTPLPGTGAWTGCLIAAVLEMDRKKAFIAAVIGLFMATTIMMLFSFGFLKSVT
jgi:uncharacterized membrane protein